MKRKLKTVMVTNINKTKNHLSS